MPDGSVADTTLAADGILVNVNRESLPTIPNRDCQLSLTRTCRAAERAVRCGDPAEAQRAGAVPLLLRWGQVCVRSDVLERGIFTDLAAFNILQTVAFLR